MLKLFQLYLHFAYTLTLMIIHLQGEAEVSD